MSLILSGCGGQSLSDREIIRGVLLSHQENGYSACLVLADQNEETQNEKICAAEGESIAQALASAEQALSGDAYYGLLDLVALPSDVELTTAREIGELLYQNAQPAPELSVLVLDSSLVEDWGKQGSTLYHQMKTLEQTYRVHCGLQQLFTQPEVCAIPVYASGKGYDFVLLANDTVPLRCSGMCEAQLAALLCGQTSLLRGTFASGRASCEARAQVLVADNLVQLHLRNVSLAPLDSSLNTKDLPGLLENEFQNAFERLYLPMHQAQADPFHLNFWQSCLYGTESALENPTLEIVFE